MINLNSHILYEDEDMVFINKPAGLVVHPDGKSKEETVSDWVLLNYPNTKNVGEPIIQKDGEKIIRPGIVHRIDRDTSGVLVVAKNQESFFFLKEQFKSRNVSKTYNAFVYGEVKKDEDVIDRPIGRSRKDFRMWSAQRGARGLMREAITEYKVINKKPEYSFLEINPKTGRTHQIRAHLKAINHPIVCDNLYAPKQKKILGFERLALHARSIKLRNLKEKDIEIFAPYPEDFEKAMRIMTK